MRGKVGWALWAGFAALALTGCGHSPREAVLGTPAARVAQHSFVGLEANGAPVGAAVAVGEGLLLTNAHVLRQAGGRVALRRPGEAEARPAELLAVSPRMDLALLRAPAGLLRPAATAPGTPAPGAPVWALGPAGLGRSLAPGRVDIPHATMRGIGEGFTARMGALMGFSGGPVVDAEGRVAGMVTALVGDDASRPVALMTGVDVVGLMAGSERRVFVISMAEALAEARRLCAGRAACGPLPGP